MRKLFLFFVLLGALYALNHSSYAHDARVNGDNIRCVPNAEFYIRGRHEAFIENNTNDVQPYYYEFKICVKDQCSRISKDVSGYVSLAPHTSTTINHGTELYYVCNGYPGTVWPEYITTRISGETSAEKTIQGTVTVING